MLARRRAAPRPRSRVRTRPGSSWWPTRRAASARPRRPSTSPPRSPSSASGCWSSTSTRRATPPRRWASSTTAACPRPTTPSSTASPLADVMQRRAPDLPGLFVVPATIDLAGAEIELVSVVARESRLQQGDRRPPAGRHRRGGGRGPLRLRVHRLPAVAGPADAQRAGGRRRDADPDPGGVLRARGPRPAARDRRDGHARTSTPASRSPPSWSPCTTPAPGSRPASPRRCASTSATRCSGPRSRARCGSRRRRRTARR